MNAPYVDVSKLDGSDQGMFSKTYMSSKITEMMRILKTRVPGQKTIIFVSVPEIYDNPSPPFFFDCSMSDSFCERDTLYHPCSPRCRDSLDIL